MEGSGRSVGAVGCMTGSALLSDFGQGPDSARQVAVSLSLLGNERKLTGSPVHTGANVLHRFWHEGRHVGGAMRLQRGKADSLFSDIGCPLVLAGAKGLLNLGERQQMVPHVGQHVLTHGSGHPDQLTGVVVCLCRPAANCRDDNEIDDSFHLMTLGQSECTKRKYRPFSMAVWQPRRRGLTSLGQRKGKLYPTSSPPQAHAGFPLMAMLLSDAQR
jgi:hypothetical protein